MELKIYTAPKIEIARIGTKGFFYDELEECTVACEITGFDKENNLYLASRNDGTPENGKPEKITPLGFYTDEEQCRVDGEYYFSDRWEAFHKGN